MINAGRRSGAVAAGIRLAGASLLAIALLLVSAAGASASSGYRYWTSFGGGLIGGEAHVAVDDSNGPSAHDVYVADTSRYRVLKFSPDGEFILMFGDEVDASTGGDVCTAASGDQCKAGVPSPWEIPPDESSPGFSSPGELAVDRSTGPTAGDVYVVDRAHGRVLRFDPGGHRDALWGEDGELRLSGAAGLAVGPSGRLFVLEPSKDLVRIFDPNATELESVSVAWGGYPLALEIDSAGDLYLPATNSEVAEFAADGSLLKHFALAGLDMAGFAVDANGGVFIAHANTGITEFPAGCPGDPCAASGTFGEASLGWAGDLALDPAGGNLYVISYREGAPSVAELLPASQIPEVTTATADVRGETEADLRGQIDAVGAPAVVGCRLQYVSEADFQATSFANAKAVPCAQQLPITSATTVSARVVGLERGNYYRFRIVAMTADKTIAGLGNRFRTPVLSGVETGPPLSLESERAALSGSVRSPAAPPVTMCEFELVTASEFASGEFAEARSIPCEPIPPYPTEVKAPVMGEATFLQPGTTYRYRVTATSSDGAVHGLTRTFVTPPLVRHLEEPEEQLERPRQHRPGPHPPSGRVPCAKRACTELLDGSTRARVWVSPRFPSTYGWLFEILVNGISLHHTALERGCRSTFAGHGMIARLNGCHGRIRLVYRGSGRMRLRWRVFANCRCAEVNGARR